MSIKGLMKRKNDSEHISIVSPVVNIQEKETCIILNAEMPGIDKEQLSVEVHGDELCIVAKRLNDVPKGYTVFLQERMPLEYKRVFSLGSQINKEEVSAKYEEGILSICLQKVETAQPKKIAIT